MCLCIINSPCPGVKVTRLDPGVESDSPAPLPLHLHIPTRDTAAHYDLACSRVERVNLSSTRTRESLPR